MIKKLIYILIFLVFCACKVNAYTQSATVEYNGCPYSFKPADKAKFMKKADVNMLLWQKSQFNQDKEFYLHEAMRYYFMAMKMDNKYIDARIGLGRVYDALKLDNYAQEHFYSALNLNNKNPKTNFYFANYYFNRDEYMMALLYYKKAYNDGYQKNFEANYRLGIIYEKLADIQNSILYYKKALAIQPNNSELYEKIRLLDDLNYSESQYYLFRK